MHSIFVVTESMCVCVCVLSMCSRSGNPGRRGMGPTQLKRHLEKQAELLNEARKILEKELEVLQVSATVIHMKEDKRLH